MIDARLRGGGHELQVLREDEGRELRKQKGEEWIAVTEVPSTLRGTAEELIRQREAESSTLLAAAAGSDSDSDDELSASLTSSLPSGDPWGQGSAQGRGAAASEEAAGAKRCATHPAEDAAPPPAKRRPARTAPANPEEQAVVPAGSEGSVPNALDMGLGAANGTAAVVATQPGPAPTRMPPQPQQQQQQQGTGTAHAPAKSAMHLQLEEVKKVFDEGLIDEDEWRKTKSKILGI